MKKTIDDIRRDNLGLLIAEFGSQAEIAHTCRINVSYLSHIMTRREKVTGKITVMGSELARKLESGCGKPLGWMDVNNNAKSIELMMIYEALTPELREQLLIRARQIVAEKK